MSAARAIVMVWLACKFAYHAVGIQRVQSCFHSFQTMLVELIRTLALDTLDSIISKQLYLRSFRYESAGAFVFFLLLARHTKIRFFTSWISINKTSLLHRRCDRFFSVILELSWNWPGLRGWGLSLALLGVPFFLHFFFSLSLCSVLQVNFQFLLSSSPIFRFWKEQHHLLGYGISGRPYILQRQVATSTTTREACSKESERIRVQRPRGCCVCFLSTCSLICDSSFFFLNTSFLLWYQPLEVRGVPPVSSI